MDFDRSEGQANGAVWAGPAALGVSLLATATQGACCIGGAPALIFALSLVGVLLGWIALRNGRENPENRTLGATGLVLSMVNLVVSVVWMLAQVGLVSTILALVWMDS